MPTNAEVGGSSPSWRTKYETRIKPVISRLVRVFRCLESRQNMPYKLQFISKNINISVAPGVAPQHLTTAKNKKRGGNDPAFVFFCPFCSLPLVPSHHWDSRIITIKFNVCSKVNANHITPPIKKGRTIKFSQSVACDKTI